MPCAHLPQLRARCLDRLAVSLLCDVRAPRGVCYISVILFEIYLVVNCCLFFLSFYLCLHLLIVIFLFIWGLFSAFKSFYFLLIGAPSLIMRRVYLQAVPLKSV